MNAKMEIAEFITKQLLNGSSYGKILSYSLFDFRSKLKQDRLNEFTKFLMTKFELITKPNPSIRDIQQQEILSDILERIVKKIISKNQKEKYNYYKNIIQKNIFNKIEYDENQIFIDILDEINSIELLILNDFNSNYYVVPKNIQKENELDGGSTEDIEEPIKKHYIEVSQKMRISESESRYFLQHLISKGLLLDISSSVYIFSEQYNVIKISDFGISFLSFIND